jgi:hypothetical protein
MMNRALSIRSGKSKQGSSSSSGPMGSARRGFSFNSLRGNIQPELSRKLFRLIKSENNLITAHETAGRERISIATQVARTWLPSGSIIARHVMCWCRPRTARLRKDAVSK